MRSEPAPDTSLPASRLNQIVEVCDRFEAAWRAGIPRAIEHMLAEVGDELRPHLLGLLLTLEVELRQQRGERPTPEEYLARFPGNEDLVRAAFPMSGLGESIEDSPPPADPVAPPDIPGRIGRYRIEQLAGRGSFGLVYLAYDEQLNRPVAVKVPHAHRVAQPEDAELYLTEARTVANLDHPHIVPVYDVGSTPQFPCFVVSKFIDGMDLKTRLKQVRLDRLRAADLVATVAEALHYAHKRGLVHRDIKPGNILIDTEGKPYVVDFGLALREQDVGKGHRYAGTPAYMSPEQARGEGHRVDGRSDTFSLGVVFYELLTGRRPFRGDSHREVMEQITTTEPRPPRQYDEMIPKEAERICLKALSKRAAERYTTAWDMAEDLRHFLQTAPEMTMPMAAPAPVSTPPGSTQEATPVSSTSRQSDSDQRPVRVVPKGLRSFDEHDADFFLDLLPGPRDREGLPDSIRFWKRRIEETDADKTFKVGLIYGPSGCGKSSLVKAGLLPRLARHVLSVYVEATPEETETRLLKVMRKVCPDLPPGLGLVDALALVRQGRLLRPGQKALIVLDQFEQWLHAKRGEENTELVAALRQCGGEHVQAIVMVRDDFWMAATRLMAELEVELIQGQNTAAVDLFDPRHARKVLMAFGVAYGNLPERTGDISRDQHAFLDQAISELAQDGKVISVRLALFAEMVKGKPWTPATLREVGGIEGVGVRFLDETFGSPQANPKHRVHQKAAQAVLKALLPVTGTDIKGRMQSEQDLQEVAAYRERPRDFEDLIHILDGELRLITPTDPEGFGDDRATTSPGGRYFQLTHDYLVPSLRDWLTRKQRETRRGRAELRLGERSALWNAKPENRLLPSLLEWANIRLLTKKKDWTAPQRAMMRRAGRVHVLRTLGVAALIALLTRAGIEGYGTIRASSLVDSLRTASTTDVPALVRQVEGYRRWANPRLRTLIRNSDDTSREKLHASLALLPVDDTQLPFLEKHLLEATPSELPVIRDALKPHRSTLLPKFWSVLESAQPGDVSLLPAASALADYDTTGPRWESVGDKVAQALVAVNSVFLGSWLTALRPVRDKLNPPLAAIFRDKTRPDTERTLATNILTDYAKDDPDLVAALLMDAGPKAYASFFPISQRHEAETVPLFREEIAKQVTSSWNDLPLDPSWTDPDASLDAKIAAARGMLTERFAFCQTMPLDECIQVAEGLRSSGYRPIRFRPYAEGTNLRVAAVWTRDGRPWRMAHDQSAEEVRKTDKQNRKEGYLPLDVAAYGETTSRFAALWVQRTGPDDDARIVLASSAAEVTKVQEGLQSAGLAPAVWHARRQPDDRIGYSGVWHKAAAGGTGKGSFRDAVSEASIPAIVAEQAGSLIDLEITAAPPPRTTKERATASLQAAEAALEAKPDDLSARCARASAHLQLGEDRKALDELNAVIERAPQVVVAYRYRAVAHARLGHKDQARADLERFQRGEAIDSSKLHLALIVAAERGEGTDEASGALEAALKRQPSDPGLHYDAACAYAVASQALARKGRGEGRGLAERALALLRNAIDNGYADSRRMQEDADLDPLRGLPAFAEIMKAGRLDRSYTIVWAGDVRFDTRPIVGRDPIAQLEESRELASQGYRVAALSVARTSLEGPPVTASVWHRPVITEETRDQLAERQARAAIALLRMGKVAEVMPLLRHSADPRLRSFIVHWLGPLGADPKILAAELDHLPATSQPTPAQGRQFMDAVLSHPETSVRRALILALGTYGTERLSTGEREPLTASLLDLYRNDPDGGIHGAAAWTLRQWGQQEKLRSLDAELMKLEDRGDRRWFVNNQGQTFVLIEGPVAFRMGSPPTEPDRYDDETPHEVAIPRRFVIADREVTVDQYQRFARSHPEYGLDRQTLSYLDPYNLEGTGPMVCVTWYGAAAYCNWLSEQENLPRNQWCYLPNPSGAYDEGMTIPADVLNRSGYRLPTGAEWEYACRSGTITSRYYGQSIGLLGKYARYGGQTNKLVWRGGSLMPNDLGLFDMLGNVDEWVQDRSELRPSGDNDIFKYENISDKNMRIIRGGCSGSGPSFVRSAFRNQRRPSDREDDFGFRPARTATVRGWNTISAGVSHQ
jgi:serine/threonine protein kinase/formylglycine-generating enzyme required for sulfatase activity